MPHKATPVPMAVIRENQPKPRGAGRRFEKGHSGNPSGRPLVAKGFREKCREFMERGGGWEALIELTESGRDQFAALSLIASYAYGKPTQPITGLDDGAITIRVQYEDADPAAPALSAAHDSR